MAITKQKDGRYRLDIRPSGSDGIRIVRYRNTRKECRLLEADFLKEYELSPDKFHRDSRCLTDLVDLWYKLHGFNLKDAKCRYSRTLSICHRLGNPQVSKFTSSHFSDYRLTRLNQVSVSTVNHEIRYLRSVFNELIRLGHYHGVNPVGTIRTYREPVQELSFLTDVQIRDLLSSCEESTNTHCAPVARLCLATGCRWSEANSLKAQFLLDDRVVFADTKNGSQRVVPIAPKLSSYLRSEGFPVRSGNLFDSSKGAFRHAIKRSGIDLPRGQLTHVLRHTYASHFMMNGGNILTLQKVLGHSDLKVTMRYAHLSPEYMRQAVDLSPIRLESMWY
jgi:integrase